MNYEVRTYFCICLLFFMINIYGVRFEEEVTISDSLNSVTNEEDQEFENDEWSSPQQLNETLSEPWNFSVGIVTDTSMDLSWLKPKSASFDKVLEYYIYFLRNNVTKCKTYSTSAPVINYTLTDLEPYAEYEVWVKAAYDNRYGDRSKGVTKQTDVNGPGPPHIVNASCITPSTLAIYWEHPFAFNRTVDYYIIEYREEESFTFRNLSIKPCSYDSDCEDLCSAWCKVDKYELTNLTSEMYEIRIRGATRSIYDDRDIPGRFSRSRKVPMMKCDVSLDGHYSIGPSAGVMAGIICACFALLLGIIAFIIWRNCLHAAYYYLEDSPPLPQTNVSDWDTKDSKSTISLSEFATHVAKLHADGDIGFSKEYETIQAVSKCHNFPAEFSLNQENKAKNRYLNVLSYDHSRVRLQPLQGQSRYGNYINANYIDGFQKANAYIGTQGPLPCTFDAFWRMIWEQGVAIIVMITNLVERGRRKCDMYWPKEGTETYGFIQVKLIKEDVLAMYTMRTLQILHTKCSQTKKKKHGFNERLVYQYHYTNWPDHGTPDHPLPILNFVKKSSAANPKDAGPIVVHCSAGVGRTGTYIVLDSMLKQIGRKNEVNVFGFLRHIRTQRSSLVQTEEQYIFIHDALLEAITCSETSLSAECLAHLLQASSQHESDTSHPHWLKLEAHFQALTAFQPKDYNLVSARKTFNQPKNRSQQFIPVECSRVHLTPKPGIDGSDYINASWCLGYKKLLEFIMTQHPLTSTVLDFWQMVWDHNAQTIVLLSPLSTDSEDQEYSIFWPIEGEILDGENFKVKLVGESEVDGMVSRNLTVQSLLDNYELTVRIVQCAVPEPLTDLPALFKLLTTVLQWHADFQNSPIVVVDRFGGTEAAAFCCLATLSEQLDYENHADVCMYAKLYHNRRPGVWQNMESYLFLYRALEELSSSKGISLVPSPPSPSHLQPNGYTCANIAAPV